MIILNVCIIFRQQKYLIIFSLNVNKNRWSLIMRRVLIKGVFDVCDRYALDWLHSEGIVRVLCGSQSQITCALKLHNDYPTVPDVTLQSVTGLPPDFDLESVQVIITDTRQFSSHSSRWTWLPLDSHWRPSVACWGIVRLMAAQLRVQSPLRGLGHC